MDIVESLRKYQCPENKGCNPVVEHCQCALMDSGADEIERLREALKRIADYEGGPVDLIWLGMAEIARSALKQKESE